MAYVNNTRAATFNVYDRFLSLVAEVKVRRAKRAIFLRTISELNALTDRELTDLGISRMGIVDLARSAAYGE